MICVGKPNAEEGLEDITSEFAAEGTMFHEVSDECLSSPLGREPYDFVGQRFEIEGFKFTWDEDAAEALIPGIEWIRAQPGTFYGEHRVDLSYWLGPNQFGTLDRGIVDTSMITIDDLKAGRGIPVSPVNNRQGKLYALGFWKKHASHIIDRNFPFRIRIDQPRCAGGGGEWMTTLGDLLDFGEEARAAAEKTRDPNAPRVASEKGCFWCKRKSAPGGCAEYDAYNLSMIGAKFEDLDSEEPLKMPVGLTAARRSVVLRHAKMIEQWLEGLHESTLSDALSGLPTPSLKAVPGRKSPDKWVDSPETQDALIAALGAERSFTKKLITPTQASKIASPEDQWLLINPQIIRGSKKPILVPEEDAREAITSHEAKFDEEN
jgi:hypothetical protein